MKTFIFVLLSAMFACAATARPRIIEEAQSLPTPSPGLTFFGESVAIDGDWALATALYSPDGSYNYPYQQRALLYRRTGDTWAFDRVLVDDVTDRVTWNDPAVAMKNGLAAVSTTPLRVFQRAGSEWAELPQPFSARPQDASWANGLTRIDGSTVASIAGRCTYGVVTAELAAGDWTPRRLVAGHPRICSYSNYSGSMDLDGNRLVFTNPQEDSIYLPDETRIYRRAAPGAAWQLDGTLPVAGVDVAVALREDELFVGSWDQPGNEVYRRGPDGWTLATHLPTLRSFGWNHGPAYHFGRNDEFVLVAESFTEEDAGGIAVYAQDPEGDYQQVAYLVSSRGDTLGPVVEISGRTVIAGGWNRDSHDIGRLYFFELPEDLSVPAVEQDDFEDGNAGGWTFESGAFTVARRGPSRVLRQSDPDGTAIAVLATRHSVNQSLQADILPTSVEGAGEGFGLATRYLNAANHYEVRLRNPDSVELRRVKGGVASSLGSHTLRVSPGNRYQVRLESIGSRHRVFVNGERLIEVTDRQLTQGRVALLTSLATADFDNVVVTATPRQSLYRADILAGGGCTEFLRERALRQSGEPGWDCSDYDAGYLRQASMEGVARAAIGPVTDDQVVESRVQLEAFADSGTQEKWLGVMTRYTDEDNYYYFTLRSSKTMSLRKLVNGRVVELGEAGFTLGTGNWHTLRLEAIGSHLRAYVNGQLLIQAVDTSHPTGISGLVTYRAAARFDYLHVVQP